MIWSDLGYPKNPGTISRERCKELHTPDPGFGSVEKRMFFFQHGNFGKLPNGQPALIYFPCFFLGGSTDSDFVFFWNCAQKR